MVSSERWSLFFDTTELRAKRIPNARLKETVQRTEAGLYICELVIEERAFQRLRDFHEEYEKLRNAKAKVERFVKVDIGNRRDDREILDQFRKGERATLEENGFIIIPREGITAAEHATLLKYRDPRIKAEKGRGVPGGLNDAIILLSSLKYAREKGLSKCLFVSDNTNDFSARLVQGLGREYSQEWRYITDVDVATRFLEDPELSKAATEFLRLNQGVLLDFVEKKRVEIWPEGSILIGPPTLDEVEAFPTERPNEGAEVTLRFNATVRFREQLPAAEPSPIRAAMAYYYVSSFVPWLSRESSRQVEGEVKTRYEKGQFAGEPKILVVRPRGLAINASDTINVNVSD